ncbi:MAG: hypothetical protein QOC83_862 [Pseudonocardiales bacterium]|nr:hypothetical protein [Pseudonocardiales bacterium]
MVIERAALDRGSARLGAYLRAAPATLIYLFTLLVTQLTLSTVDNHLGQRLLISESTNLANMARVPLQVLIGSAFWLDTSPVVTYVALATLLIVMAALERWLGTGRWLVTVLTGHIGATLLTLVVTTCLLRRGLLSPAVAHASDVGVSYALLAALGMLVHRLPRLRYRLGVALLAGVGLGVVLVLDQEIADLGHLLSFLIGVGLFPLVPRAVRAVQVAVEPATPDPATPNRVVPEPVAPDLVAPLPRPRTTLSPLSRWHLPRQRAHPTPDGPRVSPWSAAEPTNYRSQWPDPAGRE